MPIQLREYQRNILQTCLQKNTLVILPTGMGKTIIAFFLIINQLKKFPDQKIFFLAPTKPLVNQHYQNFIQSFPEYRSESIVITGELRPERREIMYKTARIIFVTPQTLQNDIIEGRVDFYNSSTIIFDEAHRAVGKYAYVFIAKKFIEQSPNPRILALTASPGWNLEKIQQVVNNLFIEAIEIRIGYEKDIRPYIKKIDIKKVDVILNDELLSVKRLLDDAINFRWQRLKELLDINKAKGKKELLDLHEELRKRLSQDPRDIKIRNALIILGEIIKIEHALELLETQTLYTFYEYFNDLKERSELSRSKTIRNVLEDIRIRKALLLAREYLNKGIEHPKLNRLVEIVKSNKDKKIIIFAQIRKTVDRIKEYLEKEGISAQKFTGKKEMKQSDQVKVLKEFAKGKFNVLIATSIGEEGIDIPKVDIVIFYEPVPSEIRSIQRRGRTGRTDVGTVIMLVTKGTRDEVFYWVAVNKERRMLKFIKELKKHIRPTIVERNEVMYKRQMQNGDKAERGIMRYLKENQVQDIQNNQDRNEKRQFSSSYKKTIPVVVADYREKDSGLVQTLAEMGVIVKLSNLNVGDYIVGDIIIERKTVLDFIKSIMDKRLFNQLEKLKDKNALLILEGEEDLMAEAGLNPNYIRSIILAVTLQYGIPIIRTQNFIDTANYLYILAKNLGKPQLIRVDRKMTDLNKIKVEVLKQIPGIGETLAKRLLRKFKNIKNIVLASKLELSNIIGESNAEKIKKVFEEDYIETV